MRLGLIGMSEVGKTHWAGQLAAAGYRCIHCDDLIARKLRPDSDVTLTLHDLGAWMGFPYEARYPAREAQYVACEIAVLHDILDGLAGDAFPEEDLVVDMGGSAIYAGADLFRELRRYLTIVYLALTPEAQEQLLRAYLRQPRPLIWRGVFPRDGAIPYPETLGDEYRRLIAFREKMYLAFCDVRIDYDVHRQVGLPVSAFLEQIRGGLSTHSGDMGAKEG
jgi:shikimate kinase